MTEPLFDGPWRCPDCRHPFATHIEQIDCPQSPYRPGDARPCWASGGRKDTDCGCTTAYAPGGVEEYALDRERAAVLHRQPS